MFSSHLMSSWSFLTLLLLCGVVTAFSLFHEQCLSGVSNHTTSRLTRMKRQSAEPDQGISEMIARLMPCFTMKPIDFSQCFDQSNPQDMAQLEKLVSFSNDGAKELHQMVQHQSEQLHKLAKEIATVSLVVMRLKGIQNKADASFGQQSGMSSVGDGDLNGAVPDINSRNEDPPEQHPNDDPGSWPRYSDEGKSGKNEDVKTRARYRFGGGDGAKLFGRRWNTNK